MKRATKESKRAIDRKVKNRTEAKPKKSSPNKNDELKRLVQLFQVNMVELEHQNLELRIAEEELEVSRNKYVNLFDFSPIPYFALDLGGIIREVNLSAGRMLGVGRNKLIGKNISTYIPIEEKDVFNAFTKAVFNSPAKQSCKLRMINKDKRVFYVSLEGLKSDDTQESEQRCQIALIDLTEYKKLEDAYKELSEELRFLKTGKNNFTG